MNREKYFDCLVKSLEELQLIPPVDSSWRLKLESAFRKAKVEPTLLSKLKEEYRTAFLNVILVNCQKNYLLCRQFSVNVNRKLFHAALSFTLLGCVLDFMLDSGNDDLRNKAREKLSEDYCAYYFVNFGKAKNDTTEDYLFEKISQGLYEIRSNNKEKYIRIINMIKNAAESEVYVLKENCTDENIVCKSLEFTRISSEILLSEIDLTDSDRELIDSIGYSFALIDDLCDCFEDELIGQANLVNRMGSTDESCTVNCMCEKLGHYIDLIKTRAIPQLYNFIFNELSEWTLSCVDLRLRIWRKYG